MPRFGMSEDYGLFMLPSSLVCWGMVMSLDSIIPVIGDLEGEQTMLYYLTLPLPQWMVFARTALFMGIQAMIFSWVILPIGVVMLWHQHPLQHIMWGKMALIFLVANIFYGFFWLMIGSRVMSMYDIGHVWLRIFFPLWMFGGNNFSWQVLYNQSKPWLCHR